MTAISDEKKIETVLVTGGTGFIGSHYTEHLVKNTELDVVVLDKLTYAGDKKKIESVLDQVEFVKADIASSKAANILGKVDAIVNFAAETHVDKSIKESKEFIHTNVEGLRNLLENSKSGIEKFVHISTDEVYGPAPEKKKFKESQKFNPSSPYAASKAAGEHLCQSFYQTHNVPVTVVRPVNNYGPRQNTEKLIPHFADKIRKDETLPVYGDGSAIRDWLYVKDTCKAVHKVLMHGKSGEAYNIGASNYRTVLEVTDSILNYFGKDRSLVEFVEDRKAHDMRYSVDSSKIRENLGWRPETDFETGLKKTLHDLNKVDGQFSFWDELSEYHA